MDNNDHQLGNNWKDAKPNYKGSLRHVMSFVISALVFRLVLDACYLFYLNSAFDDHFLTPMEVSFDLQRYMVSLILVLAMAAIVPKGKENISGLFFLSAMMFLFIPMTAMYGLNVNESELGMAVMLTSFMTALVVSSFPSVDFQLPTLKKGDRVASVVSMLFVTVFLAWTAVTGAYSNISFDLSQIYANRETIGEQLDVGVMAYINLWAQKIFNPFLLIIALYQRNRWLAFLAILLQVYFFAVTQHRAHLFSPVLVCLVYALYKHKLGLSYLYSITSCSLLVLLLSSTIFDLTEVTAVVIRRAFFVPSSVTLDWIDYFSTREKSYWSDNFLARYVSTPYTGEPLPYYLGDYFAPGKRLAFNSGIVGAGYAQAGFIGAIFYSAILGLMLRMTNRLIRIGVPVYFGAALLIAPFRTAWSDSDLFSALLSHGILIGLLVLWLCGKPTGRISADQNG